MMKAESSFQNKKDAIRQRMLALRRALSATEIDERKEGLTLLLKSLPEYKKAKTVMAFLAMKGEANMDDFIRCALEEGKEVYVPVCLPERQMEAGRILTMESFIKGPLGLRDIPKGYETISPKNIDVVFIPAVAVTKEGARLGMGAGYYDRFLPEVPLERRVAVVWDFQVLSDLPVEPFDEQMGKIVTDAEIIETKRG